MIVDDIDNYRLIVTASYVMISFCIDDNLWGAKGTMPWVEGVLKVWLGCYEMPPINKLMELTSQSVCV